MRVFCGGASEEVLRMKDECWGRAAAGVGVNYHRPELPPTGGPPFRGGDGLVGEGGVGGGDV